MVRSIRLDPKAEHIKAIYLKNGEFDPWKSPHTLKVRRASLLIISICIIVIILGSGSPNSAGIIGMISTIVIGQLILTIVAFRNIRKQRDQIVAFANSVERAGPLELLFFENGYTLKYTNAEHVERWATVSKSTLTETHVEILGTTGYLFPRASMDDHDFEWMTKVVRQRTLQLQDNPEEAFSKRPIGFK